MFGWLRKKPESPATEIQWSPIEAEIVSATCNAAAGFPWWLDFTNPPVTTCIAGGVHVAFTWRTTLSGYREPHKAGYGATRRDALIGLLEKYDRIKAVEFKKQPGTDATGDQS